MSDSENTLENVSLKNIVSRRSGHRAYVTKTLKHVYEILKIYTDEYSSRLMSYKKSLEKKLEILKQLDEIVISNTCDAEIEEEICN